MTISAPTSQRLTARVNPRVYRTINDAASLVGATANQFLVQAALEKATAILEEERIVSLTAADSETFFAALESPPQPNPALKRAFKKHKELTGGD